MLSVDADTFSTAQAVGRVSGRVLSGGTRKVEAALAGFESSVDVDELMRRIELTRPTRVTPLMFEYDLVERARSDSRRIVLPEGSDDRVLRALTSFVGAASRPSHSSERSPRFVSAKQRSD